MVGPMGVAAADVIIYWKGRSSSPAFDWWKYNSRGRFTCKFEIFLLTKTTSRDPEVTSGVLIARAILLPVQLTICIIIYLEINIQSDKVHPIFTQFFESCHTASSASFTRISKWEQSKTRDSDLWWSVILTCRELPSNDANKVCLKSVARKNHDIFPNSFMQLSYLNLIIGILTQLAAATAANGTSLPINGGAVWKRNYND